MGPFRALVTGVICLILSAAGIAQKQMPVSFGKVTPPDFTIQSDSVQPGDGAVIVAETGNTSFELNSDKWFSVIYTFKTRIKILNRNGFAAAGLSIQLPGNIGNNALQILSATTYNLEEGKVVETPLDRKSIYTEKVSADLTNVKFTLPAVKEGSLVEYGYRLISKDLFTLPAWNFQGSYPCLWSEYNVAIPEFFYYVFLSQGYHPYFSDTTTYEHKSYEVISNFNDNLRWVKQTTLKGTVLNRQWVMKDIPALKAESFTSAIKNHVARIEFQLAEYRFPGRQHEDVLGSWMSAAEKLMANENFGAPLDKLNPWLDDDMKNIVGTAESDVAKAKKIHAFVRDNFTCLSLKGYYLLDNPLKSIYKNRRGSAADLNLLLVAMLRHESIKADPVLVSTRENGFASDSYPLLDRFNYIIVRMVISDKFYFLDASHPELGFNRLPVNCYNGSARVVGMPPAPVYLLTDSLLEKKNTSVLITNEEKGKMTGKLQSRLGMIESIQTRQFIKEKGQAQFEKEVKAGFGSEFSVQNLQVDTLRNLEDPLQVQYEFSFDHGSVPLIYFNPVLTTSFRSNLLKAAQRVYPVEMNATLNETFVLHMDIPEGYVVDELPKSARTTFNGNEGQFDYIIVKTDESIQLRTSVQLKKANFAPDEYNALRDFFSFIVKKYSEQIVFKKK